MVFYRPNIENFVFPDLPNSTRCQDITDSTPNNAYPAKYLDIDIIGAYQMGNNLQLQIDGIGAGILPGSQDPLNNNKVVIKDPNGTTSFVFISDENVLPGGLSTQSFAINSINSNILDNGSVITTKILDRAVTQNKLALSSVGNPQLIDDSITNEKIHDVDGQKIDNDSITNEKIHDINGSKIDANSITVSKLAIELYNLFVPIGTTTIFCGTTGIPENWLQCNGQAISRTTYATLFANIGTEWGTGDGATTFNLPDFRGYTLVGIGADNSTGGRITNATAPEISLGKTFGAETVTLTTPQIPSHTHSFSLQSGNAYTVGASAHPLIIENINTENYVTGATGGGAPHNNTQPSRFVRFYIRAL